MTPVFDSYCALLLVSGSLVLLIGLLAGYPYGKAITRQALEPVVRAWRLAHSSLAIGGTTSLATGAAVSLAGPVGFIGLVVPHLVRLVVGSDHRLVLPASALFGAAFLIACDLVARTALSSGELPVGIVTAVTVGKRSAGF